VRPAGSAAVEAVVTCASNLADTAAMTTASTARARPSTTASAPKSPIAARAGNHSTLPGSGARETTLWERRKAIREKVPVDMIAAAWTPITKAAATTAERIWEISRVRLGPKARSRTTVRTRASAVATAPMATSTPYAASQRGPSWYARALMNGLASTVVSSVVPSAIAAMRTANRRRAEVGEDRMRSRSARE
jgi:hypothetical protein